MPLILQDLVNERQRLLIVHIIRKVLLQPLGNRRAQPIRRQYITREL
jgi:hypothetical protein